MHVMMMDCRFLALPCNQSLCTRIYTTQTLSESIHNYSSYSIYCTYFIIVVRENISKHVHHWKLGRTPLAFGA
jgi:hypothetical protein